MLGFPNPAILAAGATGRTYADWQAHIVERATGGWIGGGLPGVGGMYRTTLAPGTGDLMGSSWMSYFEAANSRVRRLLQHGMPSAAVFDAQVAAGRDVIFSLHAVGLRSEYVALNRNGYLSWGGLTEGTPAYACSLVGWWDDATQSALMMNPQAGTGPVPYTAPGW